MGYNIEAAMQLLCICFLTFSLSKSFAAVAPTPLAASSNTLAKLGPPQDPGSFTTTTIATPTLATTVLVEKSNHTNGNSTELKNLNNTSLYDHNHKILLVVLSDLNVRKVRDPQQQGSMLSASNTAGNNNSNESLIIDEQWLKDFLQKLQPAVQQGGNIKCVYPSKCVNIVPHYVPPTFPWIIRKEAFKPIVYIEPAVCEEASPTDDAALKVNKSGKGKTKGPTKTDRGQKRSRASKSTGNRQKPQTADYVLIPKFDVAQAASHSMYPINYFQNVNLAHGANPLTEYSFEDDE